MKTSKQQNLEGFWAGEHMSGGGTERLEKPWKPHTDTPPLHPANCAFPGESLLRVPELHPL